MQAEEMMRKNPSIILNIVLKSNDTKDKTFNKPTSTEIAVLMVDNADKSKLTKRDVLVTQRTTDDQIYPHQFINENISIDSIEHK